MGILTFDHLAIAAQALEEGVAWVESALCVPLEPGGQHPAMGTHNRLLSLGPHEYLEVIAIDPKATPPDRTRWFGLDRFAGPPRLVAWIARCDDLHGATEALPGSGSPLSLSRGDLRWQMAVPDQGLLPLAGAAPALIQWEGAAHPAMRLPDRACRLTALQILHPDPARIAATLQTLIADDRIEVVQGDEFKLRATIETPAGPRVLE
jgi:hypothetical protein